MISNLDTNSLFYPYTSSNIHPGFSVDCVIFSFYSRKLRVLLNKFDFGNHWQLPGGFMLKHENADDAAHRILGYRTGLEDVFLQQFYLFSDVNRTKIDQNIDLIEQHYDKNESNTNDTSKWFLQRFISLGYYAFVKYQDVNLSITKQDEPKWFDLNKLPDLYSDHQYIIDKSIEVIRSMITIIPVAQELLPEKFTMTEFRRIYEIILEKPIDRRNFQRKALTSGIVTQLDEVRSTSSYNPAILYSFSKDTKNMEEFYSLLKPLT